MTKVMTASGWAYVVLVVDWYSKKVVGHYCGEQSKSWYWLAALNKAVNRQFPKGIRGIKIELNLMSDNGSQPTSRSFMETCAGLGIKPAYRLQQSERQRRYRADDANAQRRAVLAPGMAISQ